MKRLIPRFLLFGVVLCIAAIVIESETKVLRRMVDDMLYDSYNHYLPCEALPEAAEVNSVVEEHVEEIRRIEQVDPESVVVRVDTGTCPGKADLVIFYGAHRHRVEIEAIIAGNRFHGIPFRLANW